jgi:hypothetical protein
MADEPVPKLAGPMPALGRGISGDPQRWARPAPDLPSQIALAARMNRLQFSEAPRYSLGDTGDEAAGLTD